MQRCQEPGLAKHPQGWDTQVSFLGPLLVALPCPDFLTGQILTLEA